MKKIYLFLSVLLIFSSCTEHIEDIDTSLKVGNIYCSDGSCISPTYYSGSGKKAIGVIFWVNEGSELTTDKGYAVSLEDLPSVCWADTTANFTNVSTSETAFNGAGNTATVLIFGMEKGFGTPAFDITLNFSPHNVTGWFIPSVAQAREIYKVKEKLYNAFPAVDIETFSDKWFWTSTQDGAGSANPQIFSLIISLQEGRVTSTSKINNFAVRPIIAIR